jgi:hypothetical protein
MKPPVVLFAVGIGCCFIAPGCATIPKHVSASLQVIPQPRNPMVTPGTDATGMIALNQPVLNNPLPSAGLTSQSVSKCGGVLGKLFAEWQNVDGQPMQFVHGTAAASEFSGGDFWGTHRYRDWNVLLVPNDGYDVFLAPANYFGPGGWDDNALAQDLFSSNPNLDGLIEIEWDSGFFAPEMAPLAGDETLAVGRWAFDCGHEGPSTSNPAEIIGFRAEIHAPEILLSSHIVRSDATQVHAQFKVFAGSRSGPLNTIPFIFFLQKFFTSYKNPLGGRDYSANLRAPGDGWKIASCTMNAGKRASGRAHRIKGQVQSQDGGKSLTFSLSAQNLRQTASIESSAMIDVLWVREDSSPGGGVTKCE